MALRVEAEIVLPTGGAVVSRRGVVLPGMIPGSMCRFKFHTATGQMRWSSRAVRGMVVTPCCAWRVLVHLRSRSSPCSQGQTSAQDECLVASKDCAVGGAMLKILR